MERDYCVHPGKIMKAILMSIDKNQQWLSKEMNMNKIVISNLLNAKRNVTPQIAYAFEKATGFPAEKLLAQQNKYDLFLLKQNIEKSAQITIESVDSTKWEVIFGIDNYQDAEMSSKIVAFAA